MSFKTRLETLANIQLAALEAAVPFVLTQTLPPTQAEWETAWVGAGNTLPIPSTQELYWYDGMRLRGEFKTLPDQFCLLAKSLVQGFEIRDIAGWEDDSHLLVFVVRDDLTAPSGACRLYMDGTLEEISYTGFAPDGLLGYDVVNGFLWYWEGVNVKYIDVVSEVITTALSTTTTLPDWRFFITLDDGSGDVYFGAAVAADPNPSLYFWDESGGTCTRVMTTFNPGTGAVNPDRPMAATASYVFLSELDSRAAFDGNLVHQILRSGYTYDDTVDHGTYGDEVRVVLTNTDYAADTVGVFASHLLADVPPFTWQQYGVWDGAATTFTDGLPYSRLLQTLRDNINDHGLDYYMPTRLYRDDSFVADGGDEVHFNNVGALVANPSGTKYLIHDLGWHTWTSSDAPDIWIYGDTTERIYRVSTWEQFDNDVIIVATGNFIGNSGGPIIDISAVPPEYGLIEVIGELYTSGASVAITGPNGASAKLTGLESSDVTALFHDANTLYNTDLTTNASLIHLFLFRYLPSSDYEIHHILRAYVRSATGAMVQRYSEGSGAKTGSDELTALDMNSQHGTAGSTYVVRAWRTEPRQQVNGSEYDPHMA